MENNIAITADALDDAPENQEGQEYIVQFQPHGRHPVQLVDVTLYTEMTHRVLKHQFNHVQNALFFLDAIYPTSKFGKAEVCETVNSLLQKRFTTVEEKLQGEIHRLRTILENEGIEETKSYTIETEHSLPSYSPMMTRWISLVLLADDMLRLVDALWYGSFFSSSVRASFLTKWRNALTGLSREIFGLKRRVANYDEAKAKNAKQNRKQPDTSDSSDDESEYDITSGHDGDEELTGHEITLPQSKLDTHLKTEIKVTRSKAAASA